uniref:Uncharacterized protein n=1 Tax=viral metagenome TaxID=1070528 RepID=A0A6C0L1R4_9ZZZZ
MDNNIVIKRTFCNKCYEFWVNKHPLLAIVIWLMILLSMGIGISELVKK